MTPQPIAPFVPHRGPMCLLDRLVEADEERAVAEVDVPFDGLFVCDGEVPAWVGIEYMAQAIAAWAGARAVRAGGRPRLGFLLGSRRYEARCAGFPSGVTLRVEARCELIGSNGLGMFDCRILLGGDTVATARVSVFEPPEGADLFAGPAGES
jgi:predicted hotdog family 3-hydroxylacyl-ACP dehydratase